MSLVRRAKAYRQYEKAVGELPDPIGDLSRSTLALGVLLSALYGGVITFATFSPLYLLFEPDATSVETVVTVGVVVVVWSVMTDWPMNAFVDELVGIERGVL
ncbi:MAG: hypothetical protein ABEI77_07580 [Halorientalis sp.]